MSSYQASGSGDPDTTPRQLVPITRGRQVVPGGYDTHMSGSEAGDSPSFSKSPSPDLLDGPLSRTITSRISGRGGISRPSSIASRESRRTPRPRPIPSTSTSTQLEIMEKIVSDGRAEFQRHQEEFAKQRQEIDALKKTLEAVVAAANKQFADNQAAIDVAYSAQNARIAQQAQDASDLQKTLKETQEIVEREINVLRGLSNDKSTEIQGLGSLIQDHLNKALKTVEGQLATVEESTKTVDKRVDDLYGVHETDVKYIISGIKDERKRVKQEISNVTGEIEFLNEDYQEFKTDMVTRLRLTESKVHVIMGERAKGKEREREETPDEERTRGRRTRRDTTPPPRLPSESPRRAPPPPANPLQDQIAALLAQHNPGGRHEKEPNASPPEKFKGEPSKLRTFRSELDIVFDMERSKFSRERTKIQYAASFMRDSAKTWWEANRGKLNTTSWATFDQFWSELASEYSDPSESLQAKRDLLSILQEGGGTVLEWINKVKAKNLIAGLQADRVHEHLCDSALPKTRDEFRKTHPNLAMPIGYTLQTVYDHWMAAGQIVEHEARQEKLLESRRSLLKSASGKGGVEKKRETSDGKKKATEESKKKTEPSKNRVTKTKRAKKASPSETTKPSGGTSGDTIRVPKEIWDARIAAGHCGKCCKSAHKSFDCKSDVLVTDKCPETKRAVVTKAEKKGKAAAVVNAITDAPAPIQHGRVWEIDEDLDFEIGSDEECMVLG